jgi:branched-chain amino acid transport system ATP-binding protein
MTGSASRGASLSVRDIQVTLEKVQILRGFSMEIAAGETIGLVGRNGAGKTTTLRAIMGLVRVTAGDIEVDGRSIRNSPPHIRAKLGIGYMPEDRRLVPQLTVEENILLPGWAVGASGARSRLEEIYDLMPEVARFRDRKALLLSGGQQKLAALGRALLAGERLLLLDEPFEGVAPALVARLEEVMERLRREGGRSILVSDSSLDRTKESYDRYLLIERGANEIAGARPDAAIVS